MKRPQITPKGQESQNPSEGLLPERGKLKDLHKQPLGWDYIRQLLKPSYHLRKILDDLKAAKHALSERDLDKIRDDEEALARAFRGRMFATFLLSGAFGVFGPLLGTVFQYSTGNPTEGFFVGLIIANLFGTIGYQVIWYTAHRSMYRDRAKTFGGRFLALEKDLLSLQWDGMRYTALFLLVSVPIMLLLIKGIEWMAAPVARVIPFAVIGPMVEMIFIHSSLVRVMGDLFERHSHRVAHNYWAETHPDQAEQEHLPPE